MARTMKLQASEADRRLMDALEQARDHLKGEDNGTKTEVVEFDVDAITAIRRKAGLSQPDFAERIGISVGTLRNWEQGRRTPTGPARKLLEVIDRKPDVLLELK